jgi:hypothetical protein
MMRNPETEKGSLRQLRKMMIMDLEEGVMALARLTDSYSYANDNNKRELG